MIDMISRWMPPPEPQKPLEDSKLVASSYKYWRVRILYSMFIGYTIYYFTRGSFAIVMPALKEMGLDEVSLGWTVTLFQLSYAFSKFSSGIIADRSNSRYLMAIGLIATGILNLFLGFTHAMLTILIFWGLNGFFQGWGSAPCHKLLTHWYSQSERGRWWSFWNTSHNIGSATLPLILAFAMTRWGWQAGMLLPGIIAIVVGIFLLNRLRDTPQSLGLPLVEDFRNDHPSFVQSKEEDNNLSTKEILFQYIFNNPMMWILSIGFFCIQTTRWAIATWGFYYLVTIQGYSTFIAAQALFWHQIGGFFGGIIAGWISDILFNGRRGPVMAIFSLLLVPTLYGLSYVAQMQGQSMALQGLMALSGMFIFGPHMTSQLAAAEITHKKASATAVGFLGIVAYIGCSLTGGPLGQIIRDLGWNSFFNILTFGGLFAACCFVPMWWMEEKNKSQEALA